VGAKSAKLRKNPLMRVEHDGCYALVASQGGAASHPSWYHNLVARPTVEIQDGPHRGEYSVRIADGDERADWWERAVEVWPAYADYQAKTERMIPVFVAEPA
jgi:deazaflavin-dependent oxidoreductase (nitroreductase family)